MGKRLFLFISICALVMVAQPQFLTACDAVVLTGVDDSTAVLTTPLSDPEPEPIPDPVVTTAVHRAPATGVAPVAATMSINYNVTIVTGEIVADNLSYSAIYRTGKFIYGHNTSNLLGNLGNLNIGDNFTITENGVVSNYRVADKVLYEKSANGYLNGSWSLTYDVEVNASGHSVSLMTCAGTSYGNGDASHRLVVFADRA